MGVLCFSCLLKGVSTFTGADKDKRTRTLRVSLESSPTGGFCPGLSSLMMEDIIKKHLSYFEELT